MVVGVRTFERVWLGPRFVPHRSWPALNSDRWRTDEAVTGGRGGDGKTLEFKSVWRAHSVVFRGRERRLRAEKPDALVNSIIAGLRAQLTSVAMSAPIDDCETCPGRNYSVSQLLHAVKRKLRETTLCGRCVWAR